MGGLSIVEMGSGERIVFHVIKGSQAFKKGDELIKVNDILLSSLNMFKVEELFKENRKRIRVEYLRKDKKSSVVLKLKRML